MQSEAIAAWRKPVVGWKVGRITGAFADQYQASRLAGPIFESLEAAAGEVPSMPVFAEGFAAAEAEFVLRIGKTPAPRQTQFSRDEAAEMIEAVHIGIEIASSPLGLINALGPAAVISDFGNNNGLLVGSAIPDWHHSGFEHWQVTTLIDGVEVGSGTAATFPDGAIGSARFLFELLAGRGIPLRRGDWISSGAVTGVHDARPGQRIEARFGQHGVVKCALIAAQAD